MTRILRLRFGSGAAAPLDRAGCGGEVRRRGERTTTTTMRRWAEFESTRPRGAKAELGRVAPLCVYGWAELGWLAGVRGARVSDEEEGRTR